MAKTKEAQPGIIPQNEYKEDLEQLVRFYTAKALSEPHLVFKKKYTPNKYPTKFADSREEKDYQLEEIRRLVNGYDGLSGRGYGWLNYAKIRDPEKGKISPEFRAKQEQFFQKVDEKKKQKNTGLVGFKRRRFGFTSQIAWNVEYNSMTIPFHQTGMVSKSENDSRLLFKHVKFIHQNLPDWLRPTATVSDRRDYMEYAYWVKDANGNKLKKGLQSWVTSFAPTLTSLEGNAFSELLIDEGGKISILDQIWATGEDCLRLNTERVGLPIIMGTVGDIDTDGKGLMELYKNAEAYNLERFPVYGYNGLIVDEFGNDCFEAACRWVIYERDKLKSASTKVRQAFIQKYPLEEKDAFNQVSGGGVGDIQMINDQILHLMGNPPKKVKGNMIRRTDGKIDFVPNEDHGKIIIYERPESRENGYIATCLPPGEKVLTQRGLVSIENVKKTDKLVNEKGESVEIKRFIMHEIKDEPIFKFKLSNTFRETAFTKEHPLLVSNHVKKTDYSQWKTIGRNGRDYHVFDFKFKPSGEVKVGDWVKIPNLYIKKNDFDINTLWDNTSHRVDRHIDSPLNNPDFWWLVGLYLGDGYGAGKHKISFCLNVTEQKIIDRLVNTCKDIFDRSPYISYNYEQGCVVVSISFYQLRIFLKTHFGEYSDGKRLPEWAKKIDVESKKQLLLGYLDSDGCITKDKRLGNYTTEFVSVNLKLIEGFQDILFSLGLVSSMNKLRGNSVHRIAGRDHKTKECYHLRMGHSETIELVKLLNDNRSIKLLRVDMNNLQKTRKRPVLSCFMSDDLSEIYFRIKKIESSLYTGKVYNFECDTNTFLCHHITTHNCDPVDNDDVKKTRDASEIAITICAKPFGVEPLKLVAEFAYRPLKLDEYYEQAGMLLTWYHNTKVVLEMNQGGWRARKYFEDHYPKLLALSPVSATSAKGGVEWKIGVKMTAERKEQMRGLIEDYVDNHVKFIPSIKLLEQFKVFGDDHADDDVAISFGWALIMAQSDKTVVRSREELSKNIPNLSYQKIGKTINLVSNGSIVRGGGGKFRSKSALFKF
jgi:intein/homing endonuclease